MYENVINEMLQTLGHVRLNMQGSRREWSVNNTHENKHMFSQMSDKNVFSNFSDMFLKFNWFE